MKTTTTKAPKVALCSVECATALGGRAKTFAHNVKEVDV